MGTIMPDKDDKMKYVITINKQALQDTTLNKNDIQTLVKCKLAEYFHPFFKTLKETKSPSQRKELIERLDPYSSSTTKKKGATVEGYTEVLGEAIAMCDSDTIKGFLERQKNELALMASPDLFSRHHGDMKSILDNWSTHKEDLGLSENDEKAMRSSFEYIEKLREDMEATPESFPMMNFIASLQADKLYQSTKGVTYEVSDVLEKLLKDPSLAGNVIAEMLQAHYGFITSAKYDTVNFDGTLAMALTDAAAIIPLEEFLKAIEDFKKSKVWAFESFRFEEFDDQSSGQHDQLKKLLEQLKQQGAEKGTTGNSEKAEKEGGRESGEGKNGEEPGGHGFSEGGGVAGKMADEMVKSGYDGPSMKESTANSHDLRSMMSNIMDSSKYDKKRVFNLEYKRALDRIKKIFVHDKKHKVPSASPTKRISPRKLAMRTVVPSIPIFKRNGKPKPVLKTVNLVCDMSGSMSGYHERAMMQIVGIFSDLAKSGHVKGKVVLSLPSGSMIFDLPLKEETILGLRTTFGTEGYAKTLMTSAPFLKKADFNFCITDGCITDRPIDTRALKAKGVETIGLYVGDESYQESLLQWFNKQIVRRTLDELVNEMIVRLRN
jgi:hypothetical protein